jgi:1-deoxy-D-xylulose-5-phosphate reductoisomerase
MTQDVRNVALLGSTGSIGCSTLEVIAASGGRLRAVGLTAHTRLPELERQAIQFEPRWVVATCAERARNYSWSRLPRQTDLAVGAAGVEQLVARNEVDIVVAAILGSAGLRSTWAALEAGKRVALANKETLVMAGPLVMELARSRNALLLPVDSEHSAVFQAMQSGGRGAVRRIILTASGGPFRTLSVEQMQNVSISEALDHPTWDMGRKITIDSATMMNKALEIIEARWLFDLPPEQISVVVHPQSVVHSLVEFCDGSVLAQVSPPDMRLPIQFALTYPERRECPADKLDVNVPFAWHFEPPDLERFPALGLGYEVAAAGGTAGAVLNAANEAAVGQFLEGHLAFVDIVPACHAVLQHHDFESNPVLETLVRLDTWAREEVVRWVCA